jgi:probable nitrogen fixation protein
MTEPRWDAPVAETSFLRQLVRQFRTQGAQGSWDGKSDREVLAPLVVPRERRREGHASADLDPEVFFRIELFYTAVGLTIEARTGVACTLMLKMHHEGFGRVVLLAGRLVVVNRLLRDARRFGFEGLEKLAEAGERLVAEGVHMIERFAEAAHYGA